MRVACEARACRCLCREHGPRQRGPSARGSGLLRSLSGPVPAEGPVWDAMPRLVLTVASDEGAPFCSLPPAPPSPCPSSPLPPPPPLPLLLLLPPLSSSFLSLRERSRSRTLRHLLPPVFQTVRNAVTRVHACACRTKHASSPCEQSLDFLDVASARIVNVERMCHSRSLKSSCYIL